MIRILHSVSNMDRAGVETMLMNYYRHIDRTRVQFDFLCNKKKPGAYDEEIKALGGKIYHTPGLNPFKYVSYLKYMKKLFEEHSEYSIVHAHNGAFIVYPLFAAKCNSVPNRISHVHSASFTIDYKWPLKLFCKPFIPFCANYLWACGEKAAEFYYGKKRVSINRTQVINNAIEIEKFIYNPDTRQRIRQEYNLENRIVVGHAGRFMSQKNHAFLLDIFAEVKKREGNAILVLLGDGELLGEIKKKASDLQLEDSVMFLGNIKNVNEWYQAMDVFVLPSIWEGLPVVGIEAQTADLPCVFSKDVTNEVDLLPTTTFVDRTETIERWVTAILKYTYDHERKNVAETIRKAGYDINIEANKLVNMYEEMVK